MKIALFASSLVSAYRDGVATYYRGIVRALAERGHRVTFFEPDANERQQHRDIDDPAWATVVVYSATVEATHRMVERARGSDLVVKASDVGANDELLEQAVLELAGPRTLVAFWDVDPAATLDRDPHASFRALIPRYDVVLTYGGGPPVVAAYEQLGAKRCVPIYNALDPLTHHPVSRDPHYAGALGFLGNRMPEREKRVDELFLSAAAKLPNHTFVLGGAGWNDKVMPDNVSYVGHVYTCDQNAFNVTPRAALHISRDSTSRGFSPATRVFEAAGAGACLITDAWVGIEHFLEPDREVLVAKTGDDVAHHVETLTASRATAIGERAYARMVREHTYAHRALEIEAALGDRVKATGRSIAVGPQRPLSFVFLGLSITSSWGNCHATTYRSLMRELSERGHDVLFLERDVPWYAQNRDLSEPPYGRVSLYNSLGELRDRFDRAIRDADVVVVGSYVPDGVAIGRWVTQTSRGVTAFYDLDTPVTLAQLAEGTCEYLAPNLVPRYQLYLSVTAGPILQRIERELKSPRARALYCAVDGALDAPHGRERRWALGYMGPYSNDRQAAVQRLLIEPARRMPERAFAVVGHRYPAAIEWPQNVERIDHLAPGAFYSQCSFTLNVTRREMALCGWSPTTRLFEAAACGVPIISDPWSGIEELFEPGREILVAHSADEVLGYLELSDHERDAIGARGRARVLAAHTAAHRAAELERYVREAQ